MMSADDAGGLRHLWRVTTTRLDLAGLKCPLPALMTQRALKALQPGVLLENDCTDPLIQEAGGTIETNEGNRPPNSLIEKRMACLVAAAVSALPDQDR